MTLEFAYNISKKEKVGLLKFTQMQYDGSNHQIYEICKYNHLPSFVINSNKLNSTEKVYLKWVLQFSSSLYLNHVAGIILVHGI